MFGRSITKHTLNMNLAAYGAERVNLSAPTFIPRSMYGSPTTAKGVWEAAILQARMELAYAIAHRWNVPAYVRRLVLASADAKRATF